MKTFRCNDPDCDIKFQSERSTSCPKCGGIDIYLVEEIASPGPSQCQSEAISGEAGDIFDILRELCIVAYETPYQGKEWFEAINNASERLKPFLKVETVT